MLTVHIHNWMDEWNFTRNKRIKATILWRTHDGVRTDWSYLGRTKMVRIHINLTSPRVFYIKCQHLLFGNGQYPNSPKLLYK